MHFNNYVLRLYIIDVDEAQHILANGIPTVETAFTVSTGFSAI